ncbi:hypothetical protein E2562_018715 [Oryza meyeriana var. granulata]|uniref:Uncharacterized protein n=1 Tax=Oryza meyeriana var. granulata TaxID=110450 RepID=A0A6G1EMR0_9ORYZ|nr:hypothetical protein E2562_018715 [Oryza meyeriana var. granulata]
MDLHELVHDGGSGSTTSIFMAMAGGSISARPRQCSGDGSIRTRPQQQQWIHEELVHGGGGRRTKLIHDAK